MVTDAVQCILAGLFDDARRLLAKAEEWLSMAIAECEIPIHHYGAHGRESQRYSAMALCRWLRAGEHDDESLRLAITENNSFFQTTRLDALSADLTISWYVDGEAYREAIAYCERARNFKPPKNPQKVQRRMHVGYVLAHRRLMTAYEDVDETTLLEHFFCRKSGRC